MTESRFVARDLSSDEALDKVLKGKYTWQSPSNIALVKYWGKTEPQIPTNPSISFTLSNCHTRTTIHYRRKAQVSENLDFKVIFEGHPKPDFHPKIEQFLRRILPYQPFLAAYEFEIHTQNSFPHSSGIASSASGMSALALCLMSLEKELDPTISDSYFKEKASFLARLGSGSASCPGSLLARRSSGQPQLLAHQPGRQRATAEDGVVHLAVLDLYARALPSPIQVNWPKAWSKRRFGWLRTTVRRAAKNRSSSTIRPSPMPNGACGAAARWRPKPWPRAASSAARRPLFLPGLAW